MKRILGTGHRSLAIGKLAEGCKRCVRGEKLVLFITGLCSRSCFYCPLSDKKSSVDVIFANERPVKDFSDVLLEADDMDARGAGITGGDPLMVLERTCEYIRALKNRYGKGFHIHLYTCPENASKDNLEHLHRAGLDEIRFHADLEKTSWEGISMARAFDWNVGVEVPVIPGKEQTIIRLARSADVDFINLNEFEFSELNSKRMKKKGFSTRDAYSYSIKGSREAAMKVLRSLRTCTHDVHYCTLALKDGVQLSNRLKRMAANKRLSFDRISEDGLLLRACVYLEGHEPGQARKEDEKVVDELAEMKQRIMDGLAIDETEIFIDKRKCRLITDWNYLKKIKNFIKQPCALVEEYPTFDSMEAEVEFI